MKYAGFCLRLLAFSIDSVLYAVMTLITGQILNIIGIHPSFSIFIDVTNVEIANPLSAVFAWLYFTLSESSKMA